jgi:hypothetical protein
MFCSVKFPSAMICFAVCFAQLQTNFAAVDLKVACHRAIQRWRDGTSKAQVARENSSTTHKINRIQGVVEVMARLGLMNHRNGKQLLSNQRGSRVGRHSVCYRPTLLKKYVELMGTHQVNMEGSLKKDGLMSVVECWMKMLVQMPPAAGVPSPCSGGITTRRLNWRTPKLRHRISKKCRGPRKILQSGHMVEHTRFTQMNALWLAKHHESRQSLDLNWERMTIEELGSIVSDQNGHLVTLGKLRLSIGTFAGWTGDHPLMISSTLGCLGCLTTTENSVANEALTNPENRAMLEGMVIAHKAQFQGITPRFKLLINAATQSTSASAVDEQQFSGSSESVARLAMSSSIAQEPSEAAGAQTSGMSSTQTEENIDASLPVGLCWQKIILPLSGRGHQTPCQCKGRNCMPGCPARDGGKCTNKVMRKKGEGGPWFCDSCSCRHPGGNSRARRPFGTNKKVCNDGLCKSHWLTM